MSKTKLQSLYKAKLKSSDLSLADAEKLGFKIITDTQKLEDHFFPVSSFQIPYYTPKGKKTDFYRVRYLETTKKGFARATTQKERRYDQPAAESPQLYIPHLLPRGKKWSDIFNNPEIPIVFTEGELKAACSTRHGIPTIALGGVWNFKSKKSGFLRLPVFEPLNLKKRTVFIIFDSDSATNPQVLYAQYKFAEELHHMGAYPVVINIPKIGDAKHGIDDYIVEFGIKQFKELIEDTSNHEEFEFSKELRRLNTEIALVKNPVAIMHYETSQLLNKGDAAMLYANARMIDKEMKVNKDGDEKVTYKEVGTFDKWLKWEQRGEIWTPVYDPGKDKFVLDEQGRKCFNTWRGWACEPEKGDVKLWKWLVKELFKNAEPAHVKWFEQWCAYPIQNPGVKMYSCPILFGQCKGTGKSLLGLTLMSIYGVNGAEITDTQLEDERNVFAAEKQFILANEVTGSDKRTMVGRLRNLITQHTVVINKKYTPDYTIRDTINYFFTSNHIDAVYMEDDERRFFVHECVGPKLVDVSESKVREYDRWLKSGDAARNLFHYFLNYELEGFDPTAPAPETRSKDLMVAANRTEIEDWCFKLREDPDTCLRAGNAVIPYGLFRVQDLIDIYNDSGNKRVYTKTMSNALRKAGFDKAARGQSCPTDDGKINLWAIRDDDMRTRSAAKVGKAYDTERKLNQKKKKFERK